MTKAEAWMIHLSNWRGPGFEWEPLFWTPGFVAWQTTASVNVPKAEWHHIAGIWDGKQVLTYIDGKLAGKNAQVGANIADNPADIVIARDSRACCNARKARMTVDEVMIWNRALNENEIKEVMKENAFAVNPSGKAAMTWAHLRTVR
jgi:hypothetical protein